LLADDGSAFAVRHRGETVGTVRWGLLGRHNVLNALAAIAAAAAVGVAPADVIPALSAFVSVKRRMELLGVARGVSVYDDFAHHPTAIRETALALKGRHGPGKLIVAFEPRSATSRRNVFQEQFADALSVADEVVLAPLYAPEKVAEADRLDVERLAADLRREDVPARLIPTVDATVEHLATRASPGDTVLVMTSGDYGGLHDKLLRTLGDPVMPARLEHKVRIGNLLDRVGIAHPVLEQFWPYYLVIPGEDDAAPLVGCVAIEMVGDVALLRMLAVAPERRGEGLGYVLVEAATERARSQGVRHLYLVTDGAQGYFGEKLGFAAIDRKDVVAPIQATAEYALARSKNATWMRKEL
jgi:UDP-N-acetylmuramate: L-alanyl-gamma-D-glutamyl-meso-diaminopimelate ligase